MTAFDFNTASADEIREEAERRRLRKAGWNGEAPMTPEQQRRKDMLLERDVQQRVIKLYVSHGCKVRVYSQPRKAKYMTPGGADLQVFSPVMLDLMEALKTSLNGSSEPTRSKRVMWYHETKKPRDGRYSDEQLLFAADCREAGIDVIGGGVPEAIAQLARLNLPAR
jgi:hypothetical protein